VDRWQAALENYKMAREGIRILHARVYAGKDALNQRLACWGVRAKAKAGLATAPSDMVLKLQ
jgi:hypothetical protein